MYKFKTDVDDSPKIVFVGLEKEKVFVPDFGQIGELYKQGFNNEIDLALQKPQYRNLVNSHLGQVSTMPNAPDNLTDEALADACPSREYDVNELREIAIHQAKQYQSELKKD